LPAGVGGSRGKQRRKENELGFHGGAGQSFLSSCGKGAIL
jgi:hypothetical protein